jgi:hypothetical protein
VFAEVVRVRPSAETGASVRGNGTSSGEMDK